MFLLLTSDCLGSDEERQDILSAYEECEGDMNAILENVMLSTVDDEDRFIDIIKKAIKNKEVSSHKKFQSTTTKKARETRRRAAENEAAEVEELKKETGLDKIPENDENALAALIQKRRKDAMDAVIGGLEEKYASKDKAGKNKRRKEEPTFVEPSEDEFRKLQERLFAKK